MIPKIIWQTHENKYEDLEQFQKNIINTWKNLNPGWKHIYVSSEKRAEYIKEYDSFLYDCYMLSNGINQADIWRLVATYQHGGFYADMDSVCTQSIDDILLDAYNQEEMVCSPEGFQGWCINNSNFGSTKNSTIVKEIIDNIVIEYKKVIAEQKTKIEDLGPGLPCWDVFCNTTIKNKNKIFFNSKYFSHSKDYKIFFNPQYNIFYNKAEMDYLDLARSKNWTI